MHTRAMQVKTCQCLNPRRRPSATIRIESACGVATDWVTCGFLNPKRENVNGTWRLMYSREVSINRFTKREWVTYFAEGEVKVQWELHGDPTALDVEVRHTVGKGLSCKHAPQRVTKCMVLDFWKFSKTPGSKEQRDLAASAWVNTTCRDIQTAIIKTCAYTNRLALKCAFGKEYNELYPGTIYSPPSYNAHFSSTEGW